MDTPLDMQLDMPMPRSERASAPPRVVVSVELVAYCVLLALALVLRLAELDSTPIMASETHNALAAWRVIMPNAPGEPLIASSALLFALQSVSFSLLGSSEIAARLMTALGGAALVLTPALFRPLLGSTRALLVSLMLAFSPTLLLASRASSPDVWALLLAALGLAALARAYTGQNRAAALAVVLFASAFFLTGAGGMALMLIVALAGALAWLWRRNTLVMTEDETLDRASPFDAVRGSLGLALPLAALVVLAVSTGLMLYPAGLSAVGEAVGGAIRAVAHPSGISGYATLVSLFYEPFLWLLAVIGLLARRERLTTLDIFLAAWAVLAVIVTLFFGDNLPDHALWLLAPLAGLASHALLWALASGRKRIGDLDVPTWARWLIAICTVGVIAVFSMAFHSLARSLVEAPQGGLTLFSPQPQSIVLLLVSIMFLVIGFFLFASLWGGRTSWQGIILGLALFGMFTSLGRGWHAAFFEADSPVEFWHTDATSEQTALLSRTLRDVTDRLSRGFPLMPISVIAPQDGVVAWLLRDFEAAKYIQNADDALGAQVILALRTVESEGLDAAYLGERFTISRSWDASSMTALDFPAWWTQRRVRTPWMSADEVVLWLRADVYQGVDPTSG
ncbi:MAG: glycosyltransferase family 39 protein [Anaerolineae bacterium]|nr:glycosyltransferase family 39 protein [Anaerolineae bacterium]